MTTSPRQPETFPTIIVDSALKGNCLEELDIDEQYLHDYLAAKGLSDAAINDLTIEFRNDTTIFEIDEQESRIRYLAGNYTASSKTCTLWLRSIAFDDYKLQVEVHQNDRVKFNQLFGHHVAQVLAHELEHYVADVERGYAPESLPYMKMPDGKWTDEEFARYVANPEEQRARMVEGEYAGTLTLDCPIDA